MGAPLSSPGRQDYLTDPVLVGLLGSFDTDPCCPQRMPWRTALSMIQQPRDGLKADWRGRVWLNPPFNFPDPWLDKMAHHGNGVALVPVKPETRWFQLWVLGSAWSVMFLRGRTKFFLPSGKPTKDRYVGGICLAAYSKTDALRLERVALASLPGTLVRLRYSPGSRPRRSVVHAMPRFIEEVR